MTDRVPVPLDAVVPAPAAVLRSQGIPEGAAVQERIMTLAEDSVRMFASLARPACIVGDVTASAFGDIFRGEGCNDEDAPLGTIYPRADRLVLFALTMGEEVSRTIAERFDADDFALATMLDTAASLAVERTIGLLEQRIAAEQGEDPEAPGRNRTLNYSPGYCGWHITAQRNLFRYLRPEQLGITLNDSCLMTPLKSATGILVHGARSIHDFEIGFRFCRACRGKTCLERRDRPSSTGRPAT